MSRMVIQERGVAPELPLPRVVPFSGVKRGWGDRVFRRLTRWAALSLVVVVVALAAVMVRAALPSIHAFGWTFLTTSKWNPVTEVFGALPLIYGTLVSSFLALLI